MAPQFCKLSAAAKNRPKQYLKEASTWRTSRFMYSTPAKFASLPICPLAATTATPSRRPAYSARRKTGSGCPQGRRRGEGRSPDPAQKKGAVLSGRLHPADELPVQACPKSPCPKIRRKDECAITPLQEAAAFTAIVMDRKGTPRLTESSFLLFPDYDTLQKFDGEERWLGYSC